ncbi:hypothetical protein B9P82_26965 [Citrobacter sp. L55]|uniref:hypothetical protein n=1 Tax=Citrobacter sp. L55 TaxID=1981983 RepID=UPI000CBA820C|nr:hypothetical protein [Citrobacter sp. L55]PLC60085.1 hypothetical protein B9P82_26965 [Citrobacter sp. L55]
MTSREKFEQAIKARFGDSIDYRVCKNGDGGYMAWDMQVAWWAWQAAETDMAVQLANAESKCRELASELSAVDKIHNEAVFITDDHYEQCPPEVQKMIRSLAVLKIPAYDAFLAEVRACALEYYANLFKDTVNMDVKHNQEFHKGTLYVADQLRKGASL